VTESGCTAKDPPPNFELPTSWPRALNKSFHRMTPDCTSSEDDREVTDKVATCEPCTVPVGETFPRCAGAAGTGLHVFRMDVFGLCRLIYFCN
jgi:hypothetical protein